MLEYTDSVQAKNFSGGEIRVTSTEIGKLVTVTVLPSVDATHKSFSVLLPMVQPTDRRQTQNFKTAGILTNPKCPDSIPQTGPGEIYEIIHMHGTAPAVMTAVSSAAGTGANS